jgi:hypothetical protein
MGLPSGSEFPKGVVTVIYEYTDAAGNGPAVCSFNVWVIDEEAPTISCPANATVEIDGTVSGGPVNLVASGPCGVTLSYAEPSIADNCDGATLQLTGGSGVGPNYYEYGGLYTESWQVTDVAGNTTDCSFTIEVLDPVVAYNYLSGRYHSAQ